MQEKIGEMFIGSMLQVPGQYNFLIRKGNIIFEICSSLKSCTACVPTEDETT